MGWPPSHHPPPAPRRALGNVILIITDVYGQSDNTSNVSQYITLKINPNAGPEPAINGGAGAANATSGGSAVFTNAGTVCFTGNCTTYWSMQCPDGRGAFTNRTGDSITVTVGGNSSYDVDAAGAAGTFNCGCHFRGGRRRGVKGAGLCGQHGHAGDGCARAGANMPRPSRSYTPTTHPAPPQAT